MNTVTIRKANKEDAAPIALVQVKTWRSTYGWLISHSYLDSLDIEEKTEKWKYVIENSQRLIFVACENKKVVWFISGWESYEKQGHDGEITAFYVLKEYQWQWIGKRLFYTMTREFLDLEYHSFYLWVLENGPARSFYEYMWWRYISTKKVKIGDDDIWEVSYGWKNI